MRVWYLNVKAVGTSKRKGWEARVVEVQDFPRLPESLIKRVGQLSASEFVASTEGSEWPPKASQRVRLAKATIDEYWNADQLRRYGSDAGRDTAEAYKAAVSDEERRQLALQQPDIAKAVFAENAEAAGISLTESQVTASGNVIGVGKTASGQVVKLAPSKGVDHF